MPKRLKSGHWLDAYRSRLGAKLIPFYVTRKGDYDAGAIYIRINEDELWTPEYDFMSNERKWVIISHGDAIAPYLEKLEKSDPDFWLLDVEKGGEELLFTDGL